MIKIKNINNLLNEDIIKKINIYDEVELNDIKTILQKDVNKRTKIEQLTIDSIESHIDSYLSSLNWNFWKKYSRKYKENFIYHFHNHYDNFDLYLSSDFKIPKAFVSKEETKQILNEEFDNKIEFIYETINYDINNYDNVIDHNF